MFKDALHKSRVLYGALIVGGGLACFAGAASAEEITVYGSPALSAEAVKAAFEADMQDYSRSLHRELKQAVVDELRETVAPRLMLAAAEVSEGRG